MKQTASEFFGTAELFCLLTPLPQNSVTCNTDLFIAS